MLLELLLLPLPVVSLLTILIRVWSGASEDDEGDEVNETKAGGGGAGGDTS